jgi:hypothetical protein
MGHGFGPGLGAETLANAIDRAVRISAGCGPGEAQKRGANLVGMASFPGWFHGSPLPAASLQD